MFALPSLYQQPPPLHAHSGACGHYSFEPIFAWDAPDAFAAQMATDEDHCASPASSVSSSALSAFSPWLSPASSLSPSLSESTSPQHPPYAFPASPSPEPSPASEDDVESLFDGTDAASPMSPANAAPLAKSSAQSVTLDNLQILTHKPGCLAKAQSCASDLEALHHLSVCSCPAKLALRPCSSEDGATHYYSISCPVCAADSDRERPFVSCILTLHDLIRDSVRLWIHFTSQHPDTSLMFAGDKCIDCQSVMSNTKQSNRKRHVATHALGLFLFWCGACGARYKFRSDIKSNSACNCKDYFSSLTSLKTKDDVIQFSEDGRLRTTVGIESVLSSSLFRTSRHGDLLEAHFDVGAADAEVEKTLLKVWFLEDEERAVSAEDLLDAFECLDFQHQHQHQLQLQLQFQLQFQFQFQLQQQPTASTDSDGFAYFLS